MNEQRDVRTVPDECFEEASEHEAELAAEHFFAYHDGWEYEWPLEIQVIDKNGQTSGFKVELEHAPVFTASEAI